MWFSTRNLPLWQRIPLQIIIHSYRCQMPFVTDDLSFISSALHSKLILVSPLFAVLTQKFYAKYFFMHDSLVRCEPIGGLTNTEVKTERWSDSWSTFGCFGDEATSKQGAAMSLLCEPWRYLLASPIFCLLIGFFFFPIFWNFSMWRHRRAISHTSFAETFNVFSIKWSITLRSYQRFVLPFCNHSNFRYLKQL